MTSFGDVKLTTSDFFIAFLALVKPHAVGGCPALHFVHIPLQTLKGMNSHPQREQNELNSVFCLLNNIF